MDTSELYIKMMQGAWRNLSGDIPLSVTPFSRRLRMLYILDDEVVMWREKVDTSNCDRAIPLLEQDQLQEMVIENMDLPPTLREFQPIDNKLWNMLVAFKNWARDYIGIEPRFASMEQLWLAFAMLTLCSKRWDGNEWIKI